MEAPSSVSFPSLFAFAALKEAWVNDCWSGLEEGEGWFPQFSGLFNDWEVEDVGRLLAQLGKVTLVNEVEDTLKWKVTQGGCFSVKSLCMALESQH